MNILSNKDFKSVTKLLTEVWELATQLRHSYSLIKLKKFDEKKYRQFKIACIKLDRKLKLLTELDKEYCNNKDTM